MPTGSQGRVETLDIKSRRCRGWPLSTAGCHTRPWCWRKPRVPQELDAGKATYTCRSLPRTRTRTRKQNPFFLHCFSSTLYKQSLMSNGKAKILQGSRCMFRDQVKKLNLEMADNKLITKKITFTKNSPLSNVYF